MIRKRCLGMYVQWCRKCVRWTDYNPTGKNLIEPPAYYGRNGWTCRKRVVFFEERAMK
jgi:hypothetical protein